MDKTEKIIRDISLNDELSTSVKLIQLGLGELQNIDFANDFYHLPFQLLSSGFERLMKCIICLGSLHKKGTYPKKDTIKTHDLFKLKNILLANYFSKDKRPVLLDDYNYISKDEELKKLLFLLSEFGKFARYYNLDVITGDKEKKIDVKSLWQEYETNVLVNDKKLFNDFSNYEKQAEVYQIITNKIVVKLEKLARALSRQFTLGDLGEKAMQFSPSVTDFIVIPDDKLGKKDYRKHTTRFNAQEKKVHKRNVIDFFNRKFNKNFKQKKINKNDFNEEWPFRTDEVIIECRNKYCVVVTIEGMDYALNGTASSRYKLETVHDAGMAILGKSISPFIDEGFKLAEKNKL